MNPDNSQQPQTEGSDIQKTTPTPVVPEAPVDQPVVNSTVQPAVATVDSVEVMQQPTGSPESTKKSPLLLFAIILIAISLIATLIYIFGSQLFITPKACTMEAKICSDGSSVGRTGPNCEFSACPVATITPIETPIVTASPSASPVINPTSSPSGSPTSSPSASPSSI